MLLVRGRYTTAINRDEETAARAINNWTAFLGFTLPFWRGSFICIQRSTITNPTFHEKKLPIFYFLLFFFFLFTNFVFSFFSLLLWLNRNEIKNHHYHRPIINSIFNAANDWE